MVFRSPTELLGFSPPYHECLGELDRAGRKPNNFEATDIEDSHMARGTNLKWIQAQGGWSSAKMLLDVYGHFMPTESAGYADALTAPDGTIRHQIGKGAPVPAGAGW